MMIKREVNGILLIDKHIGITSNKILQKIKRLFLAKKAGHSGTLDPISSGMLVICFGLATKFSQFILNSNKKYRVIAKLGEKTDTFDAYGKITATNSIKFLNKRYIQNVLNEFQGEIKQIPPMFSAIKYKGIPLYKYARQNINILREPRNIYINKIQLNYIKDNLIELNVSCSKGTYIRSLINDIGDKLGCGAYVYALKRLHIDIYSKYKMLNFYDLKNIKKHKNKFSSIDKLLLPVYTSIKHLPKCNISLSDEKKIYLKQNIYVPYLKQTEFIRIFNWNNSKFLALGKMKTYEYILPYYIF